MVATLAVVPVTPNWFGVELRLTVREKSWADLMMPAWADTKGSARVKAVKRRYFFILLLLLILHVFF